MDTGFEHRTRGRYKAAVSLGQVVSQLMAEQISPRQARLCEVADLWGRLLPSSLHEHCRIVDISRGLLKVEVDSPSYLYELQLCSEELLEELQRQCPGARVKRIKFVVA
ncbi:MAG: DUF721 domain-containing protein [Phycisphaerales bacterium]|nr:MAG: DUF721 domain-containing protein [Phycisphaerales bacterium]